MVSAHGIGIYATLCHPCTQENLVVEAVMNRQKLITIFEWIGSVLGMVYALLIASNTGHELLAFALLLTSAILFAAWAIIDKKWAFLALQVFYAVSAIIGFVRWG